MRLFYSSKVGWAAAELNLEKAGLIEMIQGHRAGLMREGLDNMWCDLRWRLECAMLPDPVLEIAEWDAEYEANDVATNCSGCDVMTRCSGSTGGIPSTSTYERNEFARNTPTSISRKQVR